MPRKLRVFVASTSRDLPNERHEVVRAIRELNFEPVNAEGWRSDGTTPWSRIEREIESSDLFLLVLGQEYGFRPSAGPGAAEGLSVTHMEARRARALGLPVFPFLKRLDYDDPLRGTEDGTRRDAFREEVSAWEGGYLVTPFELASDLGEKVQEALVGVLSESYLKSVVTDRAGRVAPLVPAAPAPRRLDPATLPDPLVESVLGRQMILVAGAGMSLAAGYPSARAIAEVLANRMREDEGEETAVPGGVPLQEIAANFEAAFGRVALMEVVRSALELPQGAEPTVAHRRAVEMLDIIVTSNYDNLFEMAAAERGFSFARLTAGEDIRELRQPLLIKVSGSLHAPETFLITERDVWHGMTWEGHSLLRRVIDAAPVLVVGSSLRDINLRAMLYDRSPGKHPGYIVAPNFDAFERHRFRWMGLAPIDADADSFFTALAERVGDAGGSA